VTATISPTATLAGWLVTEEAFDPSRQGAQETNFTIGNGRFGTRGSLEEGYPGDRPATLVHGVFAPHPLAFTELANLPDWTALEVVVDGHRFSLAAGEVLRYRRSLDLRSATLRRDVTWRSPGGATVELQFERFASLAENRLAAVRVNVRSVDFDGPVEVRAGLNARAETDGLAHVAWDGQGVGEQSAWLGLHLKRTDLRAGLAMRLEVADAAAEHRAWDVREHPTLIARWQAKPGESATFEKKVCLLTSRDTPTPTDEAETRSREHWPSFDELHEASAAAWETEWARCDLVIEGDAHSQLAVRFSIYHLLIAAPRDDDRVSIGAKALSGFGYRGHVFWDTETFMLPLFSQVRPHIARNLLSYRHHRLPGARRKATLNGYEGAQFPWESADTGEEVTPKWLPDMTGHGKELIRIWTGDIEIHITADIAHAVMRYWRATGDDEFMVRKGAEIVIDGARFWASRAEWNATAERYEYTDVIGPDEYHDHVDNNAFTNYMAAWHLRTAAELCRWLPAADEAHATVLIGDSRQLEEMIARFEHVAAKIYLPYDARTGLIEQFDGYFQLRDVDLKAYPDRNLSMQALLGIDGVAKTQVIKQADVLMLACMLPEVFSESDLAANYAYYSSRTDHTHGSSLGPPIQALMAARMNQPAEAYTHFLRAAEADLADIRLNASAGIHAANAGALWQAVVFGFAGLRFEDGRPITDAHLPANWHRISFRVEQHGREVQIDLSGAAGAVEPAAGEALTGEAATGEAAGAGGPIRGFIFDLDGVITDTAEYHYRAWQRLADEIGVPFDRRANEALRGVSRRESLRRLLGLRKVREVEADRLMARKNDYYRQLIATLTPDDILPGALEFIDEARGRGLRLAIGSASQNAQTVLEKLGIGDRFDAICDGNSVTMPKPAPDLFLAAAAALDLPPAATVVFEDATDGVAAGRAAGALTVGIGPAERVGEADVVLPDGLARAEVESVIRQLTERRASVTQGL
jgi:kojibiose phosphorylase